MSITDLLQLIFYYDSTLKKIDTLLPDETAIGTPTKMGKDFFLYLELLKKYTDTLRKIQAFEKKSIIRLQEKKLRELLLSADKTHWWHLYFLANSIKPNDIRTLDDLGRIPPIDRNNLVDVPREEFLNCKTNDPTIVWRRSGGSSTGTPIEWGVDRKALVLNNLSNLIRSLEDQGFFKNKNSFQYIGLNYGNEPQRTDFRHFALGNFFLKYETEEFEEQFHTVCRIIEHLNGTSVIRITPSELLAFTQELKKRNYRPPIGAFVVVGNILDDTIKKFASEYFSCPVIAYYGTQEFGSAGILCQDNPRNYHILSERVIVETLDEEHAPVSRGCEGHVTVTSLDSTAMPLIRYQPGDLGIIRYNIECRCINNSPLLELSQRSGEFIKFSDGSEKSARFLLRFFSRVPFIYIVRRFQISQKELDKVLVTLESRYPLPLEAREAIRNLTTKYYGTLFQIEVREVSRIEQPTSKFRVFIPLKI